MLFRLRGDAGSAVADFVVLVVPASLLALPLLDLFGLYQSAIVKEQVVYDIARFSALADVTGIDVLKYKSARDPNALISKDSSAMSCSMLASSTFDRRITWWPELITVKVQERVECENE